MQSDLLFTASAVSDVASFRRASPPLYTVRHLSVLLPDSLQNIGFCGIVWFCPVILLRGLLSGVSVAMRGHPA